MKNLTLCLLFNTVALGSVLHLANADVTIATGGKSTFTIVIPAKAPDSVDAAAKELQRDLEESTNAKLPIRTDNETVSGAVISLGSTIQAKAAGFDAAKIPDSGFRIVTKNGNLYIIGMDTAAKVNLSRKFWGDMIPQPGTPGPQYTSDGGWSNGTANGVYTFLEDYLNVRWLMPGELGRDVPVKSTFTIPDLDRAETPEFNYRDLSLLEKYTQSIPAVADWQNKQKLGFSFRINHQHNWFQTINRVGGSQGGNLNTDAGRKFYKEHPDWFAMDADGKRPLPKDQYGKLETTNPDLVKWFAEQAIDYLKADPHANTFSLSPADGRGYSQSPESLKYYEPSPTTIFDPESTPGAPSVTRLILKFYRDVATIVEKEYPQGKLAGYIYQDYLYPPKDGNMTLPDNFTPMIAMSPSYAFGMYDPKVRERFDYVMDNWARVAPSNWYYYDLPNTLRSTAGLVTSPAPEILNYIFPNLLKNHIKGFVLYGNSNWSSSAITNYIGAKMLWNPKLNANDLQREWLVRAYGEKAGTAMEDFHHKLDEYTAEFYRKYSYNGRYNVREVLFKYLYAPHYAELEKVLLQAAAQPMTAPQKARFQLFEDNFAVLRWRLVNGGYIKQETESPLKRNGAQIAALMFDGSEPRQTPDNAFDLQSVVWYGNQPKSTFVKVSTDKAPSASSKSVPNSGYIMIYASEPGEIKIKPESVQAGSAFVGYRLYEPYSTRFRLKQQGLFYQNGDITFDAKKDTLYLLRVTTQDIILSKLDYTIAVPNAKAATVNYDGETLYWQDGGAPVSVFVPKGLDIYTDDTPTGARLRTMSPADAARVEVLKEYPNMQLRMGLDSKWKFITDPQKEGVAKKYFAPDFNDKDWKTINATATWQDQGYPSYHGTAWYRKSFGLSTLNAGKVLLFFGAVDGDAVVYANGQKVGEHILASDGKGWDEPFVIDVTNVVKKGATNITVQVTKNSNASGIYNGVALLEEK